MESMIQRRRTCVFMGIQMKIGKSAFQLKNFLQSFLSPLSLVVVHSDCWLLSVAFYLGARLDRNERKRLFSMINDLPTVFEVVTEWKAVNDKPSGDSGSKSRGSTKRSSDGRVKSIPKMADEDEEDEHRETLCGTCGGNYNADEFWIGFDICERWYHGKSENNNTC